MERLGGMSTGFPANPGVPSFLKQMLGELRPLPDVTYELVLAFVPASRLLAYSLVDTRAGIRLLHMRGQGLPDWFVLRWKWGESFQGAVFA